MEVIVTYSKVQLEEAVNFIATHNDAFLGKHDYIRDQILSHMRDIARDPEGFLSGTMGYVLWGDREFEGIDGDTNRIRFDISVDPALSMDAWEEENCVEETVISDGSEDIQ